MRRTAVASATARKSSPGKSGFWDGAVMRQLNRLQARLHSKELCREGRTNGPPSKRAACAPSRSAPDIDGHRAFSEAANRPDMPLISFEFYSKPTHKVTHFHMLEEIK